MPQHSTSSVRSTSARRASPRRAGVRRAVRSGLFGLVVLAGLLSPYVVDDGVGSSTPASAVIPEGSTSTAIPAGAYVVDMGRSPQTAANTLRAYGFVQELLVKHWTPVTWVINDAKPTDGTDFVAGGKTYRGGPFIIQAEDVTAEVLAAIQTWRSLGVTIDGPMTTGFDVPVYETLTNWPNVVLDAKNGDIAAEFYSLARVPASQTMPNGVARATYVWKDPAQLNVCDDLYVMPHADPTWATHSNLLDFNNAGGGIWAGCHAISVLESLDGPDAGTAPDMNFLSTNGLVNYKSHGDGLGSARTADGGNPANQYLGSTETAHLNGSERIFIPAPESQWRPGTDIIQWDPTNPSGALAPARAAATAVFGRGFDQPANGLVMYEGGHNIAKDGGAGSVAAIRAYFNMHLLVGIDRGMQVAVSVPAEVTTGQTATLSATIRGGAATAGSNAQADGYQYEWFSSCGGTFSPSATGATMTGDVSVQFTAPVPAVNDCQLRIVVLDDCYRLSFGKGVLDVIPAADLSIEKTDGIASARICDTITYTIAVENAGPSPADPVTVSDAWPSQLAFVSATPAQGTCAMMAGALECALGRIDVRARTSITVVGTVLDEALGMIENVASVTAPQPDPNPGDNTAADETEVDIRGSIGDVIWHDIDGDGIQDADEPGRGGVTIELLDADGAVAATAVSADDGSYLFEGLPLGVYTLRPVVPEQAELSPVGAGDDLTLDSDVDPATGESLPITLTAAARDRTDIDLGIVPLGSIAWSKIAEGSISADAPDGVPLVGSGWQLVGPGHPADDPLTVEDDDRDGRFQIEGLLLGTYTVTEVVPPIGYALGDPAAAFTVVLTLDAAAHVEAPIENAQRVITLPIAGSTGTTPFGIAGASLIFIATALCAAVPVAPTPTEPAPSEPAPTPAPSEPAPTPPSQSVPPAAPGDELPRTGSSMDGALMTTGVALALLLSGTLLMFRRRHH